MRVANMTDNRGAGTRCRPAPWEWRMRAKAYTAYKRDAITVDDTPSRISGYGLSRLRGLAGGKLLHPAGRFLDVLDECPSRIE